MTTEQPQEQRRASHDFWITCPQCHKTFSVPKGWVLKYLERIGYVREENEADQTSEVPF